MFVIKPLPQPHNIHCENYAPTTRSTRRELRNTKRRELRNPTPTKNKTSLGIARIFLLTTSLRSCDISKKSAYRSIIEYFFNFGSLHSNGKTQPITGKTRPISRLSVVLCCPLSYLSSAALRLLSASSRARRSSILHSLLAVSSPPPAHSTAKLRRCISRLFPCRFNSASISPPRSITITGLFMIVRMMNSRIVSPLADIALSIKFFSFSFARNV